MEHNGETYTHCPAAWTPVPPPETFEEMLHRHAETIQTAGDNGTFGDSSGLGLLVQFIYEAKSAGLIEIKA